MAIYPCEAHNYWPGYLCPKCHPESAIMSERDEFEAWAGRNFLDVTRNRGVVIDYVKPDTQLAWLAWQAARAPQAVPVLTDEQIVGLADLWSENFDESEFPVFDNMETVLKFARALLAEAAPQPPQEPEKAPQHYQD